jgi:hypothetical protein
MSVNEIGPLVASLASANLSERETAARAIFQMGADRVAPLLREWSADPELAPLFKKGAEFLRLTVGLAVLRGRFDGIRAANGSPRLADVPPDQDAQEFELEFAGGVRLDILTSRAPAGSGAIARYLAKFGEGIQQVEVDVNDVDRATQLLEARFAMQPIYPSTRAGANGTRINFFLAALPDGTKLLVELVS